MKALTKLALAALVVTTALAVPFEMAGAAEKKDVAYVASVNREPFHRPTCEWAMKISPGNHQSFKTRDDAIKAGHRPCKVCRP